MKKLAIIFGILLTGMAVYATPLKTDNYTRSAYDGNAYIFVEGNVEFSVFPDGQFDFVYVGPNKGSQVIINSPNVNISYNAGYNYDVYVQYDDYGAVIQIEDVPVYYDAYGRIIQAGNVDIQYNDRRLVRVGGLRVIYNNYGYFSHCTGVINMYNPYYIYRPWHVYYARPYYTHVIVYDYPYRMYYHPIRYSYHQHVIYYKNRSNVAYVNGRRDFYRPGSRIHYEDGRVARNNDFDPNRRNTMIADTGRNNQNGQTTGTSTNIRNTNGQTTRTNTSNIRSEAQNNVRSNNTGLSTSNTRTVTGSGQTVAPNTTRTVTPTKAPQTPRQTVNSNTRNSVSTPVKAAPQTNTRSVNTNTTRATTPVKATPQPTRSVTPSTTRSSTPTKVQSSSPTVRQTSAPTRSSSNVSPSRGATSRQSAPAVRGRG